MNPVTISPIPKTYLDNDTALAANSDLKVPTQKAVKAYADTKQSALTKATGAEVTTGTDDAKYTTPKAIKDAGIVAVTLPVKASGAEIITGTDDAKFATAKALADAGIPTLIAAPGSDHSASGILITLTATANMAFGDVGHIASTGKVTLIDADAIASMSGVVMAIATINANAAGLFLVLGVARDDTWAWTVGGLIYGTVTGTSGNTLSQTAPTGADDVIQILGVATHADRMLFNPQLVQIEHI